MASIIFQNFIEELYRSSKNTNNEIEKNKFYGVDFFETLQRIPSDNLIIYIGVIFLIFNFVNRFNVGLNQIFAFLISIIVLYFLVRIDYSDFTTYTKEKHSQLKFLHKLMFENKEAYIWASPNNLLSPPMHPYEKSYLFLDPLIVELFFRVRDISSYNINAYVNSLYCCNNILGIEYEIKLGLNREYLNYSSALFEKEQAMNALNSCIYDVPAGYTPKAMKAISILQSLLDSHLRNIGKYCKNENVVNEFTIASKPDDFYDINFVISPDDTKTRDYNSTYNMYT